MKNFSVYRIKSAGVHLKNIATLVVVGNGLAILFGLAISQMDYSEIKGAYIVLGLLILGISILILINIYRAGDHLANCDDNLGDTNNEISISNVPLVIVNTIKIDNLEISSIDYPNQIKWDDANKICSEFGSGWRLPTKEELNEMFKSKDKIGGFSNNFYWSATESNNLFSWGHDFNSGKQLGKNKKWVGCVRAVKSSV